MIKTKKYLLCDNCGKTADLSPALDAGDLRRFAKSAGWRQWNAVDKCPKCCRKMTQPVAKIDPQSGDVVMTYATISQAAKKSNVHRSGILRSIKDGGTSGGFRWSKN